MYSYTHNNVYFKDVIMNGNNLVTKTNDLVSKAAYNFSNLEQLLFTSALSEIDSREEISDQIYYKLDLKKLSILANITSNRRYSEFKKAIERLYLRRLTIPKDDGTMKVCGFIQSFEYHNGNASLSIKFSNDILPYISSIRDSFISYRFKQIAQFKSSYSVRLYELLIQRLDISNIRTLELHDLRHLFQLGKSYQSYSNIKLKVITPSIKDINTYSDINVIYKEIRTGRKVTALEFHIEALEPRPNTKKQIEQKALPGESYKEVEQRLKEEKEPKKTPFWKSLFK